MLYECILQCGIQGLIVKLKNKINTKISIKNVLFFFTMYFYSKILPTCHEQLHTLQQSNKKKNFKLSMHGERKKVGKLHTNKMELITSQLDFSSL